MSVGNGQLFHFIEKNIGDWCTSILRGYYNYVQVVIFRLRAGHNQLNQRMHN